MRGAVVRDNEELAQLWRRGIKDEGYRPIC